LAVGAQRLAVGRGAVDLVSGLPDCLASTDKGYPRLRFVRRTPLMRRACAALSTKPG
jgi:hypothetical protein